jgi:hypothetical protein
MAVVDDIPPDRSRYTVPQAARILGISPEAVRNRFSRGTLDSVKDGGTVYVLIDRDMAPPQNDIPSDIPGESNALISEMRERVTFLERELERRGEEAAELRRIIAALTSRIPQIEALSEERESPVTPSEDEGEGGVPRPWWRRLFGV